jgi:long-chain acyl-CoA synthetase
VASEGSAPTVTGRFVATVRDRPDAVALRRRRNRDEAENGAGDEFESLTWAGYGDRAARAAAGLLDLGVARGDRVVLLIDNRPEFHVADVGALLAGATPISIYNSSSPEQIQFLAGHCAARVAIVGDVDHLERLLEVRDALPSLEHVVLIDDAEPDAVTTSTVLRWRELLDHEPVSLDDAAAAARPEELATVIYTSGTTGPPKGVMLDHANITWTADSLETRLGHDPVGYRIVSYLPMAHIAERLVTHYSGIQFGYEVTCVADIRALGAELVATKPQLLFGVPRTWEKIHSGIQAVLAVDPSRADVFRRALDLGARVAALDAEGLEPDSALRAEHEQAENEVLLPVRTLLGLDQVEFAVTAAAPIPVEVLTFFRALGVPLSELYGLSESTGPMTWEPSHVKLGSVGTAIPGMELRIAGDGEVLGRGGNVFRGYLEDPAKTAETVDPDGWLHTGDIGEIDDEGYLRIVDRKKELIITAGGKNISPANIEAALKAEPLIGQACVIGDDRPYLVALIVPDPDVVPAWAKAEGIEGASLAEIAEHPGLRAEIAREVASANRRFSRVEQVRHFAVIGHEWMPDSDELTPTMKLKRKPIAQKYAPEIDSLYADPT